MDTSAAIRPAAFSISYRSLETWSVAAQFAAKWSWSDKIIKPLGGILSRRTEAALESLVSDAQVTLLTIHFDGSIEPRKPIRIKDVKGKLFRVYPGDVVFSKIDVRNGAIGLAPDNIDYMCVTSEFPVYSVNARKAHSEYVKILFRTVAFKNLLNSMISGTSGRKRIQPSQLEGVKIPIPPLPIQKKIVAYWKAAQAAVTTAKERATQIEKEIQSQFLAYLGLPKPKRSIPPKCFSANWDIIERWSVSYNQAAMSMLDLTHGKYPVIELGCILEMVQYGTSEKANTKGEGIPVLRIKNIKDGRIDATELKHIPLSKKTLEGLRLADDDILIIRTSGSKNLVGTCAVFHEECEFVFASYLIRLRPSPDKALSDYVAWYINSSVGRQQVDALSRHIMQNNINSQELRSLRLPLPPLDVQKEIMAHIKVGRNEIVQQGGTVNRLHIQTQTEIEKLILGTLSVEEL